MGSKALGFTVEQENLIWDLHRRGESIREIERVLGVTMPRIRRFLRESGGIRPVPRARRIGHITAGEREEISRGIAASDSARTIAGALDGPTMGDGTGGATAGYDCSGLVRFAVFQAAGKELPRTSQIQFTVGTQISWDSAQPGDLVFGNWQADGANHVAIYADGANHVAIYLGGGRMIEVPQTGQLVQMSDVRSDMVPVRLF